MGKILSKGQIEQLKDLNPELVRQRPTLKQSIADVSYALGMVMVIASVMAIVFFIYMEVVE